MGAIAAGIATLAGILVLIRSEAYADPKTLVRLLRYFSAAGLGVATILLAVTGRLAPAMFVGSMAWGLATGGHIWPAGWPHFSRPSSGTKAGSGSTSVRSAWIEMELDHASGEMRGTILKGSRAGRKLEQLRQEEILDLYREASDDPDTCRLLETFMDRRFGPEWRNAAGSAKAPPSSGAMSPEEALKVLGLSEGATEDQIRAAHRRLMTQNHPDHGGSDYLAAKINQARDVLLAR